MKTNHSLLLVTILLSAFLLPSAFAQGPLAPPGAPAPTMKSLDQIEARTPVSSAPFAINASGSYYLTKNLTVTTGDAISVNASDVTLDLNGFTISSTQSPAGSGAGISLSSSLRNIAILNGAVSSGVTVSGGTYSGTGFGHGINYSGSAPATARVSQVSVAGCLMNGINLGFTSSVVEACTVDTAGGSGIQATSISHSTALNTGIGGFFGNTISDCYGTSAGYGIYAAATAINSYGQASGSLPGIYATTATNCWGVGATGSGVQATNIDNCFGTTSGASNSGIKGDTVANSRGTSSGAGYGLLANGSANNSYGYNSSTTGSGLNASIANNCYGSAAGSGTGVSATYIASNCYGVSSTGAGIIAGDMTNKAVAIGCYGYTQSTNTSNMNTPAIGARTMAFCVGYNPADGYSLVAYIANGCSSLFGVRNITNIYNMP